MTQKFVPKISASTFSWSGRALLAYKVILVDGGQRTDKRTDNECKGVRLI